MATESAMTGDAAQAYRVLCDFCSTMLTESPSGELLGRLIDQRELLLEEPFSAVALEAATGLHDLLASADKQGREDFETAVKRDYTYLFYMVGASHTSPFESVYRTDDRTMFGPTTLEVREAYRAWEVQAPEFGSTPDDHLGYEFAFLAHLLGAAADAQGVSEDDAAKRAFADARTFLSDHVLIFARVYLKNVKARAREPFYRHVAGIAEATVASLADALNARAADEIDEAAYLLAR